VHKDTAELSTDRGIPRKDGVACPSEGYKGTGQGLVLLLECETYTNGGGVAEIVSEETKEQPTRSGPPNSGLSGVNNPPFEIREVESL
jgi:hypothetical protein